MLPWYTHEYTHMYLQHYVLLRANDLYSSTVSGKKVFQVAAHTKMCVRERINNYLNCVYKRMDIGI